MELRHISPDALVKLVHENPLKGFHSPMAGLKWLVKKFRTKTRSAVDLASAVGAQSVPSLPVEAPRCEKCGNTGRILQRIEGEPRPIATDEYCDCRMGREIEAVERRKHTATATHDGNSVRGRPLWGSGAAGKETGDQYVAN